MSRRFPTDGYLKLMNLFSLATWTHDALHEVCRFDTTKNRRHDHKLEQKWKLCFSLEEVCRKTDAPWWRKWAFSDFWSNSKNVFSSRLNFRNLQSSDQVLFISHAPSGPAARGALWVTVPKHLTTAWSDQVTAGRIWAAEFRRSHNLRPALSLFLSCSLALDLNHLHVEFLFLWFCCI